MLVLLSEIVFIIHIWKKVLNFFHKEKECCTLNCSRVLTRFSPYLWKVKYQQRRLKWFAQGQRMSKGSGRAEIKRGALYPTCALSSGLCSCPLKGSQNWMSNARVLGAGYALQCQRISILVLEKWTGTGHRTLMLLSSPSLPEINSEPWAVRNH